MAKIAFVVVVIVVRFASDPAQSGVGRGQVRVCRREQRRTRNLIRSQPLRPRYNFSVNANIYSMLHTGDG